MHILFPSEPKITLFLVLVRLHSLSFVEPFVVICSNSLSLVVCPVVTRCHLLSLVVIPCHSLLLFATRFHTLSLVVSLVVTCCNSFYHSLSFVVTPCSTLCHSLSLDVPLVCLFINDSKFQNHLVAVFILKPFKSDAVWLILIQHVSI